MYCTEESSSLPHDDHILRKFESQLRQLAHQMLGSFPTVRRWEETDDVVQAALIRFHKSIDSIEIRSPLHFRRLAALQIRRQLLSLAERYGRDSSHAANYESCHGEVPVSAVVSETPSLEEWARFHHAVEGLPDKVLETFELVWYAGLSQQQTADQLGVSLRQVQRRWMTAKFMIANQVCQKAILAK